MASNPCLARLAASFLLPASNNVNTNTTKTQIIQTQHQTHKMKKTTFPLKMGPLSHSASSTSSGHVHNIDPFGRNILLNREESVETVLKPTWPGLPRWCCLWPLCSQIAGSWCSGCCCCCYCCWSCCWCSPQRQRWWKSFRQTSGEQAEIIYLSQCNMFPILSPLSSGIACFLQAISTFLYSRVGSRGREVKYKVCTSLS